MRALVLSFSLLISVSAAALAQPAAARGDRLAAASVPDLPEGAKPSDALRAAQGALATGRLGEAEEALEMAETRMLDRSVRSDIRTTRATNPTVGQISQARQALAAHDRATCMQFIQAAIASATAQGL